MPRIDRKRPISIYLKLPMQPAEDDGCVIKGISYVLQARTKNALKER